jgi:hypothetical protein
LGTVPRFDVKARGGVVVYVSASVGGVADRVVSKLDGDGLTRVQSSADPGGGDELCMAGKMGIRIMGLRLRGQPHRACLIASEHCQ